MAEQQHLDRLSAVDASFLIQEGANTHMHIGGVATFEGPPPGYEEFLEHIDTRLSLVPRYRQKIAVPPLRAGRPLWIDDPSFNLPYHVRHTALPSPGSEEQLLRLTGRVFSQRLDRTKPLWEIWLVDGYNGSGRREESGRFALLTKTHHALVDGVSGVDLMTMLFDVTPVPRKVERGEWLPQPEPSGAQLVATGVKAVVGGGVELAAGAFGALGRPRHALHRARETVEGIAEVAWAGLNPPPDTPLSADTGPHRRFQVVNAQLAELKQIKNALGGTVNDVVLAVVAGALARFLRTRGVRTEGLQLRACVPVSVRDDSGRGAMGNQITQILCPLPVYVGDPVERLRIVRETMDGLKESKQALGAEAIAGMENFAPPTLLAQASRLHFSSRMYTLLVTNIPGPQFPLYVLGREMQGMVPVPFLGGKRALAIAILSYNGRIAFGLLGDYDSLPDLDLIADGLRDSIAELLAVAQRARPSEDATAKATTRAASNGSPD
jgi:diacylglycerol O-acyltransferase / wax synthase